MKKIKFSHAIKIAWDISLVFEEANKKSSYDIGVFYYKILVTLNYQYGGEVSIKEIMDDLLSRHPKISKSKLEVKLSKIIKYLLEKDLLIKTRDEKDKRIKIIKISEKGHEVLKEIKKISKKIWEDN